jgi:hypothetical protein
MAVRRFEAVSPCLGAGVIPPRLWQYLIEMKRLVDVAGLEPAAPCLQSRLGKTLKCFDGVAYTDFQQNSRSPNVPKLYRVFDLSSFSALRSLPIDPNSIVTILGAYITSTARLIRQAGGQTEAEIKAVVP